MAVTSASENKRQKIINYDELLSGKKLEKMKEAAVLICFYKQNDEYYFPLIKRPMHEKNHPGQIALPGGSKENDESLEETALREAFEEVGIDPENVKLLGKLTPLPVPVSNYLIHPFIGITENEPSWKLNKDEVDELILLKFNDLIKSDNGYCEEKNLNNNELKVPTFKILNLEIWGATAAVLSELIDISN